MENKCPGSEPSSPQEDVDKPQDKRRGPLFLRPTEGVLRLEPKESANHPLTRILFKNLKTKMKPNYI